MTLLTLLQTYASGTTHDSSGALSAGSAVVAGTAAHEPFHYTSGALAAGAATVAGTAARTRVHSSSGALTAQSATVAGSATKFRVHLSSGALSGQSSTVSGTATKFRAHASSGALSADSAVIDGEAEQLTPGAPHESSGALTADSAEVAGSAQVVSAAVEQNSGGWNYLPDYPRRKRREVSTDVPLETTEELQARIVAAQQGIALRKQIRDAERRDQQVTAQLRAIYAEQDALQLTKLQLEQILEGQQQEDEDIAIILALAG